MKKRDKMIFVCCECGHLSLPVSDEWYSYDLCVKCAKKLGYIDNK